MPENKYKVVKCEHCGILTYKNSRYKTMKCPMCRKPLEGEPMKFFAKVKEAIAYIKQQKLREKATEGDNFIETFS
jgi:hypothetical protein